ncbi:hypothetical protein [Trinickia fusca]|uniref:DUF3592 domain-containing protein n=1 Tax=Trinickia fusca TaxID=2419777 RepID=A0A494XC27_9BURK|nr:hypothetical protein [Trinickia fusca]RKP47492.1 hypothetical protein D7S89_14740 [Trinickia fusca]
MAAVTCIIAAGWTYGAVNSYLTSKAFKNDSTVVEGHVLRLEPGSNGNLSPLVGYSYGGRQYERLIRDKDGRYNRGALLKLELQVRLVKSSPAIAIVTRWEQPPMVWPVALGAFILLNVALGLTVSIWRPGPFASTTVK